MEAQACYSLGNTYTLLKDYNSAIEYHLRHLAIAQELLDRVGEGRACWSLGNAHSALGQHQEAYQYASKHLAISRATGDKMGQATAQLNIAELSKAIGGGGGGKRADTNGISGRATSVVDAASRRLSMEKMDLLKMTPEVRGNQAAKKNAAAAAARAPVDSPLLSSPAHNKSGLLDDEEDFFDFITRFQSKRMDDQRCTMSVPNSNPSVRKQNLPQASNPSMPMPPKGMYSFTFHCIHICEF